MIGYVKCFDSNKTMSFKVIDNKLLKKYNKIWEKVSSLMNIRIFTIYKNIYHIQNICADQYQRV